MSTSNDTLPRTTGTQARGTKAPADVWRIVARREIAVQGGSKGFRIGLGVTLLAIVATIVGTNILQNRETTQTVAVADSAAAQVVQSARDVASTIDDNLTLEVDQVDGPSAAESAVESGAADVALLATADGYEIVAEKEVDGTVGQALTSAVASTVLAQNAASADVDLEQLNSGTATSERLLDPAAKDAGTRQFASFVFVLLFFMVALTLGMQIAMSVTQEKESRVVEILAAAVPIRQLLWGKVVGNTVLAVGQIVAMVAVGLVTLVATGQTRVLEIVSAPMLWYVVFFVLGFVSLACLWAVAGSMASRQQDVSSTATPVTMLIMAPYFISTLGNDTMQTVMSMVPVVSAMTMPSQMVMGSVPAWQVAVAIGGTLVAAYVFVRVGERVFERTVLRTGDKIGFREALTLEE